MATDGSVDAHPHPVWCWDAGWDARFNHRVLVWGYGYSPASSQPGAADAPMGTELQGEATLEIGLGLLTRLYAEKLTCTCRTVGLKQVVS